MHSAERARRPLSYLLILTARPAIVIAFIVFAAALGLTWLSGTNSDLPPLVEFVRDAQRVVLPALDGKTPLLETIFTDHFAGAHAWHRFWLDAGGQWDARVLATANLVLLLAGLGAFLIGIGSQLGQLRVTLLGLCAIAIALLTPLAPRASFDATWSALFILLSILHATLWVGRETAGSLTLGWLSGLANVVASSLGIASTVAMFGFDLIALIRSPRERRSFHAFRLIANLALLGAGAFLVSLRGGLPVEPTLAIANLGSILASPFGNSVGALVVWAPALLLLTRNVIRTDRPSRFELLLVTSACTVVAAAGVLAGISEKGASEWAAFAILLNAACWFAPGNERATTSLTRRVVIVSLWSILVLQALFHLSTASAAGPAADSPIALALRENTADKRHKKLRAAGVSDDLQVFLDAILSNQAFRHILPTSIRPPLAISPDIENPSVFSSINIPDLPGRNDLPALGTWSAHASGDVGQFVSRPISSSTGLLQFRIAGTLHDPETSLAVQTSDGREFLPLETDFSSNSRWRRVVLPVPSGLFRIVAHDKSSAHWLAFTAPQETSWLAWLTTKLIQTAPWWLGVSLTLGVAAVAAGIISQRSHLNSLPTFTFNWRVVPWLGLFAYALFCSQHIDATAGPNDSGGYLNLAKIFASGHIHGEPRMLWGPSAGETDIRPYLPTTFQVSADGRMAPEYPDGYPLELAALSVFMSLDHAVHVLIIVQLVLGVLFTHRLARVFGLPEGWSWFAGFIVALSPVYIFQGLQPQSDSPALVWITAAVGFAWSSRERPWHAILAGLATALAIMIRPANLLCVIPVGLCFWGRWRQLAYWIIAGLPAGIWQLWFQHHMYGSMLRTGYGDVSTWFGWEFFLPTLHSYAIWLPLMFTPLVVLAPVGFFLRPRLAGRGILGVWAGLFLCFYVVYWCTYDNWFNMRFVLPAAPALIVLSLHAVRELAARKGLELFSSASLLRNLLPTAALATLAFGIQLYDAGQRDLLFWLRANRDHRTAAEWARDHLPANAVLFARHSFNTLWHYTDFTIVRSDTAFAHSPDTFARIAASGRPIYACNLHWEIPDYKWGGPKGDGKPTLPGNWELVTTLCENDHTVWRWVSPSAEPKSP